MQQLHHAMYGALSQGEGLRGMNHGVLGKLAEELNEIDGKGRKVEMMDWLKGLYGKASAEMLYGVENPVKWDESIISGIWYLFCLHPLSHIWLTQEGNSSPTLDYWFWTSTQPSRRGRGTELVCMSRRPLRSIMTWVFRNMRVCLSAIVRSARGIGDLIRMRSPKAKFQSSLRQ